MELKKIRKKIAKAGYANSLLYDYPFFDKSIIGVDENEKVVYDYDKMAVEFAEDDKEESIKEYRKNLPEGTEMSDDEIFDELIFEAYEFIDYNTLRATPYAGQLASVVVRDMEYMDDEYEGGTKYENVVNGEPYRSKIVFKL